MLSLPYQIQAQSLDDALAAMEIGESLGHYVSDAVNAAAGMREASVQATSEIQAARARYWEAIRTGRDVDAAEEAFARALAGKDFYYLWLAIPEGTSGPRSQILNLISGGIDGGIRPAARPQFERWVKAVRVHLGAESWFDRSQRQQQMVIPNLRELAAALDSARVQQMFYRRARDWAEIDASSLRFPWDTDARAYALVLLQRYGRPRTAQEVRAGYRELVDLAGEPAVLAAAERVRAARRTPSGELADPAALGVISTSPEAAFTEILAVSSGAAFLKYLLWQVAASPEEADRVFDRWVLAYGREKVEAAAAEIMARRDEQRYQSWGVEGLYIDILELLAKASLDGYLRAVVAHGEEVSSRQELERALQDLSARYGEDQVRDAAARLRMAWYTDLVFGIGDSGVFSSEISQERRRQIDRRAEYDQLVLLLKDGLTPALQNFPVAECGLGSLPGVGWDRPTDPVPQGGVEALLAQLEYPPEDRAAGRQGRVEVQAFVDATGRVAHARVLREEDASDRMKEAALQLVRSATFTPGTWEGTPTCTGVTIEVPFRMGAGDAEPCPDGIFSIAEEMPVLEGGLESLNQRIQYTEAARKAGVRGRVMLKFVVDREGKVLAPQVVRGLGSGLDEEALRVIQTASFKPGRHQGNPVCVEMSLPIGFSPR